MSLIGNKYVNLLAHMHMYYQLLSVSAVTYLCCIPRYVLLGRKWSEPWPGRNFYKKITFFFSIQNAKGNTVSFACKIITISVAL